MRPPEPVDYEAVLADLRAKRDQLNAAIAAIEQFVMGRPAAVPADEQPPAAVPETVRSDSFFGMSAAEAAEKYLRMMKKPQETKTIEAALVGGGYLTNSKNFYANLYTSLKRSDQFVKIGTSTWGLAEWYQGRRLDQRPRASNGSEKLEPAPPASQAVEEESSSPD